MKLNIKLVVIAISIFAFLNDAYAWYSLTINNNFSQTLTTTLGNASNISINPATSYSYSTVSGESVNINIPGYGTVVLQDLGSNHIEGDSSQTWGILISYQDNDVVARYEAGGGPLVLAVGPYGNIALGGNGMVLNNVVIDRLIITN